MTDLSSDLLFLLDLEDQEIIYINNRVEKMLGQDALQVYDKGDDFFREILHPEDYNRFLAHIEACKKLQEEEEKEIELRLKIREGSWNWFKLRAKSFERQTDGKVLKINCVAQCIQDQVNARERRSVNEALLQQTEEVAGLGSYEADLNTMQFHLSDGFYRLFGYEPQGFEARLDFIDSVSHPDDVQSVRNVLEQARQNKQPYEYRRRIHLPNGQMRTLCSKGRVVCDEAGNAVKLLGIVEDVSDQVRTDQIMDNVNEVCFELDKAFRFTFANHKACLDWHKSSEEIIGNNIWEVFPELRGSLIYDTFIKAIESHTQILQEAYCPVIERWIFINANPSPNGLIVLHFDITKEVEARHKLDEYQEQIKKLVDNTPDVITRWDRNLKLLYANSAFELKTGVSNETLLGKTNLEMGQPEHIAIPWMEKIQRVLDASTTIDHYNSFPTPEGEVYFYSRLIPELASNGSVQSVLAIARDITELKRNEQELERAFAELADSSYMIRQMLDSSVAAICLFSTLRDEKGVIQDFIFRGANKASEIINQRTESSLLGKKMLEEFPVIDQQIFRDYIEVVETGEPMRKVHYFTGMHYNSWIDVSVVKNGDGIIMTFYDVTDLKKAQEALQKSEEKYRTLFESVGEGFCIIELIFDDKGVPCDYLFVEVNPAFEKHSGIKNAKGRRMREIAPEHEEFWFEIYGEVALSGEPVRFENWSQQLGRWFHVSAFRYGAPESGMVALLFKDITQRRSAEQELKDSKTLLQKVFNSSTNGISVLRCIRDEHNHIIDFEYMLANKTTEQRAGNKELKGKRYSELYSDYQNERLFGMLREVVGSGDPQSLEFHYQNKGEEKWFNTTAVKFEDGVVLSSEDITIRKKSEEELSEKAHFIQQITETTPDLLVVFDVALRAPVYMNHDLGALLGFGPSSPKQMKTKQLFAFIHPDDVEQALAYHSSFIKAKDEDIVESAFRLRSKEGEERWFQHRGRVFKRNQKGEVIQYLTIQREITEEKKILKALLEAEQLSVKGKIARTIAHEVRGPLVNINLALELLRNEKELEEGQAYLDIVSNSSRRIEHFINDLLNISKEEAKDFQPTVLAELVEETIALAEDRIFLKSIQVEKYFSGASVVLADQERLKIALLNIIHNAIEAVEAEKGLLKFAVQEQEHSIELIVQDNGCGMNHEQLGKMFDAYYTSKPTGLGVGLANVKNILTEHEALVEVKSEPGKGTSFKVKFKKA